MGKEVSEVPALLDPHKVLDGQEKLFCLEYLKDFNEERAAKDTGFPVKMAYRMLSRPEIADYIHQSVVARAKSIATSATQVLQEILACARQCAKSGDFKEARGFYALAMQHLGQDLRRPVEPTNAPPVNVGVQIVLGRDEQDRQLERSPQLHAQAAIVPGRSDGSGIVQTPPKAKVRRK